MTDKERILMTIISELATTNLLGRPKPGTLLKEDFNGELMAQFVGRHYRRPQKDDIVLCKTSRVGKWKIARFVADERGSDGTGHWLLREIGGEALCKMGNEELDVLVGIHPNRLLEGQKQRVYDWVYRAFNEDYNSAADYLVRCGGVEWLDGKIRVWSRPHVWAQTRRRENEPEMYAQPRAVEILWGDDSTFESVCSSLSEAGAFSREWEWAEARASQGMGGCLIFTRD